MSLKKTAAVVCCIAALSAVGLQAAATKIIVKNLPAPIFQGIDDTGALDGGANVGIVSASVNLKTKTAVLSGKATVPNLTFKKVVFLNADVLGIGAALISDKYTVSAVGKAAYSAKIFVAI
jgi:hypothetical protein